MFLCQGALTSVCAQPKSLAERCEHARHAAATLFGGGEADGSSRVPSVVVDTMENSFADMRVHWK